MGMPLERKIPNESATKSRSKKELLKLVHKLRWAGMDEEAGGSCKPCTTRRPSRKTKLSRRRQTPTSGYGAV